jgi:hypothetical protein
VAHQGHGPATAGPSSTWAADMARHRSEEAMAMRHMQMQHAMRSGPAAFQQPMMYQPSMGMISLMLIVAIDTYILFCSALRNDG